MQTLQPIEVDIRTPVVHDASSSVIEDYAHLLVEVSDLERALRFYTGQLGFGVVERTSEGTRLQVGLHHSIILVVREQPKALPDSGAHHAYCFSAGELQSVLDRLAAGSVEVHRYHEDRPAEQTQNRYCLDPDGNRVQLVEGENAGIDHVAVEVSDIEWAETFYTQVLGGQVEFRVGWHMDDYQRAYLWGDGIEDCAPGTRRWDKRYTTMEGQARLPRPNAHIFVNFGSGLAFGIYLATEHRQEPPPRQFTGTPRTAFRLESGGLANLQERLRTIRLRCMKSSPQTQGPFELLDHSMFVRDPAGNFLEFVE